jgi:hypothetical protein
MKLLSRSVCAADAFQLVVPSLLVKVVVTLLLATPAGAQCLTGLGSTGFESGIQTYSVVPANGATMSQVEGVTCGPNSGEIDHMAGTGAGRASFSSDYQGYGLHTSASSGGDSTGTSYAGAGGTVRWTVRVDSQPAYAGPTTVDIDLTALIDISGALQVSGSGSGGVMLLGVSLLGAGLLRSRRG